MCGGTHGYYIQRSNIDMQKASVSSNPEDKYVNNAEDKYVNSFSVL